MQVVQHIGNAPILLAMKTRGCLVAAAIAFAVLATVAALIGPTLLRNGERLYRPIAQMSSAQKEFESWTSSQNYAAPEGIEVSASQLDRFLELRGALARIEQANPMPEEHLTDRQKPSFADIEGVLQGVGSSVTQGMDAYRKAGMTPAEYGYLERVIYQSWLRRLKASGTDPAAIRRLAAEVKGLAASERNAIAAIALRRLAADLAERRVTAPDGVPAEVHGLLLSRAEAIESLAEGSPRAPIPAGARSSQGRSHQR